MKHFTKLLLSALIYLAFSAPALAYDFEVDGIFYKILSDNTVGVTHKGEGDMPIYSGTPNSYRDDVVIPSSVSFEGKDFPVTAIGDYAFYGCYNLTSVMIPNSVIEIGYSAFQDCTSLTSVEIPYSVEYIADHAFAMCI